MHAVFSWKPRQGLSYDDFLVRPINIRELESQKLASAQSRECPQMNHGVGILAEERGDVNEFPHKILSRRNNCTILHGREFQSLRGIVVDVALLDCAAAFLANQHYLEQGQRCGASCSKGNLRALRRSSQPRLTVCRGASSSRNMGPNDAEALSHTRTKSILEYSNVW